MTGSSEAGAKKKKRRDRGERNPRRSVHTRASRVLDEYDFGDEGDSLDMDDVARKLPDSDGEDA